MTVCVPNIGPRERMKRLAMGLMMLAIGIGIASGLVLAGINRSWRVVLFIPFWLAAVGIFQAWEKT